MSGVKAPALLHAQERLRPRSERAGEVQLCEGSGTNNELDPVQTSKDALLTRPMYDTTFRVIFLVFDRTLTHCGN